MLFYQRANALAACAWLWPRAAPRVRSDTIKPRHIKPHKLVQVCSITLSTFLLLKYSTISITSRTCCSPADHQFPNPPTTLYRYIPGRDAVESISHLLPTARRLLRTFLLAMLRATTKKRAHVESTTQIARKKTRTAPNKKTALTQPEGEGTLEPIRSDEM